MKRLLALLMVAAMAMAMLAGCSADTQPASGGTQPASSGTQPAEATKQSSEVIRIKFGVSSVAESCQGKSAQVFADLANERLAGQVEVSLYPNEQLGSNETMMENMLSDLQQCMMSSLDLYSIYSSDLNIMTMAFAFKNVDHLNAFLSSEYGKAIWDDLYEKGFKILSYNFNRKPRLFCSKTPIARLSDMKGLKWRVPNIDIYQKNFRALGAVPTYVAWNEVSYALMQGVVDACETTYECVYTAGIHNYAPYLTLIDYGFAKDSLAINTATWEKLTPEQQEVLQKCADEAADFYNDTIDKQWEEESKKIEAEGGKFVDFDRDSFTSILDDYAKQLEDEGFWKTPGLFEKVQELSY